MTYVCSFPSVCIKGHDLAKTGSGQTQPQKFEKFERTRQRAEGVACLFCLSVCMPHLLGDVGAEEGLVLSEGLQKTRRSRRCSQVSL